MMIARSASAAASDFARAPVGYSRSVGTACGCFRHDAATRVAMMSPCSAARASLRNKVRIGDRVAASAGFCWRRFKTRRGDGRVHALARGGQGPCEPQSADGQPRPVGCHAARVARPQQPRAPGRWSTSCASCSHLEHQPVTISFFDARGALRRRHLPRRRGRKAKRPALGPLCPENRGCGGRI